MKYIVIVPDGAADWPIEEIGGRTPLEAAHTTNMDYMAQRGMTGLVQTIPNKMNPGSDVGNLALLGYNPANYYTGRAPLEAANLGITLAEDEIAFRCNLVTMANSVLVDYSAGHIGNKEAAELIEALNKAIPDEEIRFFAGKSYRHLMVLRTPLWKDFVKLKTTPPHDIMGQEIKKHLPAGKNAQKILSIMERARAILEKHPINQVRVDLKENPANAIWLWGQGRCPQIPLFKEKFGMQGGIISAVDLVNGIGRLAGLEVIHVPGATGYYDTNYAGKVQYALNSLKKNDFVFVHIEAPDEAGHNGDLKNKIGSIEKIDREIVGAVLNNFDPHDDFRVLILPDHPTPIAKRSHTSEPVCFLMYGKGIVPDGSQQFCEKAAAEKGLCFKSGEALMEYFINHK